MKLTDLKRNEFLNIFGSLYENSPFIAEKVYEEGLEKYSSAQEILFSMMTVVNRMSRKDQLKLIKEHPELGMRKQEASKLTEHSQKEQKGAGLDRLSDDEFEKLRLLNINYMKKFNFPFIIAVTGLNKKDIFENIEMRVKNGVDQEFETSLNEIHKIAKIRLDKII